MTSPKILSYIVFSTLCTSAMAQDDVCDVIKNTKRHYAVLYEASTNGGRTFFKSENHIYRRDDGTVVVVNVSGDLILSKTIYERARSASEGGKNQNMGHVGSM